MLFNNIVDIKNLYDDGEVMSREILFFLKIGAKNFFFDNCGYGMGRAWRYSDVILEGVG